METFIKKNYNKFTLIVASIVIACTIGTSCSEVIPEPDSPDMPDNQTTEHTLLMYFPWSVNLTSFFTANIADMELSISENGLDNQRVLVFFASAPSEAVLFEIKRNNLGIVTRDTISEYPSHPYTTVEGLTKMIKDVKEVAPAKNYSLLIGAHGMAWIPVSRASNMVYSTDNMDNFTEHWNMEVDEKNPIRTRYFGGTSATYQTDISTLVTALEQTETHLQYILFDDCFMSSIEVAYELRNCADYLIASVCEIMDYGMPYHKIGKYMLGNPNYEKIVSEFYDFYSTYTPMPCGTIGVTNLNEMDNMATIMKEINTTLQNTNTKTNIDNVQIFDGYSPTLFFDFGHYVETICANSQPNLYDRFHAQLERTVPYKLATQTFYTMSQRKRIEINHYSGINTTEPSLNSQSVNHYKQTDWYNATHE